MNKEVTRNNRGAHSPLAPDKTLVLRLGPLQEAWLKSVVELYGQQGWQRKVLLEEGAVKVVFLSAWKCDQQTPKARVIRIRPDVSQSDEYERFRLSLGFPNQQVDFFVNAEGVHLEVAARPRALACRECP